MIIFVVEGLILLVLIALSLLWIVTRRERYSATTPGPGYERTSEVLVDPETGRRQRVYMNPQTGARAYVDEPAREQT